MLAAVLDASNHALFSCSTECRIASWNRAAERIFGHAAGDIIATILVSLFPAHLQPEIEQLSEAADAGEGVDRMLVEIERRDGMTIPIALSLRPVAGQDGSFAGCMVVVDDLTRPVSPKLRWPRSRTLPACTPTIASASGCSWRTPSNPCTPSMTSIA